MARKKKPNWGCIGGILLALINIVIGTVALVQHFQKKAAEAPFRSMAEHYKVVCDICTSQVSEYLTYEFDKLPYSPYLHGRVLVVEAISGEAIGSTMTELSSEISATKPEEVSTLVCSGEVEEVECGTYTGGTKAICKKRNFGVYDIDDEKVIFAARIYGASPPKFIQNPGQEFGSDPTHDPLVQMLEGWPRR